MTIHIERTSVLTELPFVYWRDLQKKFAHDRRKNFLAFESLKNYIELEKSGKVTGTKIYVLDGDWSDGTFILQDSGLYTIIYTLEESCRRLRTALLLLDWFKGPRIHPYLGRFKNVLNSVYAELNLPVLYDGDMTWRWLDKETALNFSLELPDVHVAPLREHDADYINEFWPHKYEGSENWLRNLIKNNISRGVFLKENNKLVAWIMRMNNGIVTSLHTHPDYVRKGYGSLVLRAISKAIAEGGSDTVGCVVDGNYKSSLLFDKLGFIDQGPMHWSKVAPFTSTPAKFTNITNEIELSRVHAREEYKAIIAV